MRVAAYVYPGWHPIPERDRSIRPGFTEWDLVTGCAPRFPGHAQPRLPLLGPYDDRDPVAVGERVRLARAHGVDALVYGLFWCRGKRVFEEALDRGLLGSAEGATTPFGLLWANRMPRGVLPVRRADLPVIEGSRLVPTDADDFVALIAHVAERYFVRPNYLKVAGRPYFSIFDSTFSVSVLGAGEAARAIAGARAWLRAHDFPDLHLAAVDPARQVVGDIRALGFDSVTHYVLLPDWRGPLTQDYEERALLRAGEWADHAARSGLPYMPSIAPGWDASPRALDLGAERPGKYPWSPVVTGESPARFEAALRRGVEFTAAHGHPDPLLFVASLNEWSEGHYLEPDQRWGTGWLEALLRATGRRGTL